MSGKSSARASNFEDESSTNIGWSQCFTPAIICTLTAILVLQLRWYSRLALVRMVGWEDALITFAMILSFIYTVLIGCQVGIGFGTIDWMKDPHRIQKMTQYLLAGNTLYSILINVTKTSIIVQYLRIFFGKIFRIICYTILIILLAAMLYGVFGAIFLCNPPRKYWINDLPGHCSDAKTYWVASASINIIMDFVIWILPMPLISQLHLPLRHKVGLILVFALGGFVCIASIVRVAVVVTASNSNNFLRSGVAAITWSAVEANVGIVCASLMAIKPLIMRFFPGLMGSQSPSRHNLRVNTIVDEEADSWGASTRVGSEASGKRESQLGLSFGEMGEVVSPPREVSMMVARPKLVHTVTRSSRGSGGSQGSGGSGGLVGGTQRAGSRTPEHLIGIAL